MKIPAYILLSLFLFINQNLSAQKFDWIELAGGSGLDYIHDMVLDDNYIYVTGYFQNSVTFGTTTLNCVGYNDYFIAKYDTLGNFYWAKSFGGSNNAGYPIEIDTDNNGDVILGGTYIDTFKVGNIQLNSSTYIGNFLIKFNSNGNLQWVKSVDYGRNATSYNYYLHISCIGNDIYLNGRLNDSLYFDGNFISFGSERGFLLKVNKNGSVIWDRYMEFKKRYFNNSNSYADDIETDEDGSIFLAGQYFDTLQSSTYTVISTGTKLNNSIADIFIAKFDSSGSAQWLKTTSDSSYSSLTDLAIDNSGDLYLTGPLYYSSYYSSEKFKWDTLNLKDEGQYIVKLDPNGNSLWGNIYTDDGMTTRFNNISIGNDKAIFITGYFNNTISIGLNDSLVSRGTYDALMMKIDSTGEFLWAQQAGGGGFDYGTAVAADQKGNAYFGGYFTGLSLFGTRIISSVNGSNDAYLFKLSECEGGHANIQVIGDTVSCDASMASIRLKSENKLGYAFQWMKNQMLLPGENFPNLFPIDSGDYAVIVNDNGCLDTSRTVSITFDTVPNVSYQATFDSICAADAPVLLSGGMPIGGSWSGKAVKNGYFDPTLADTGYVKVSYIFSNGLCSDSASQLIYVSPAPQPIISGLQQVCENTSGISYSSNSPGPDYVWTVSGGTLVAGQGTNSISVNWGSSGMGIISLIETNNGGCQNTDSDTIEIADPIILASITGQDTVCINSGSYNYSIAASSYFYNWNVNGGNIVSGQGSSSVKVNWNTSGKGLLSVRLFNSCGSDSTFYDTVYVSPKPNPQVTGSIQVCENSSGIVYSSSSAGPGYFWKVTNGSLLSGQGTSSIQVDWNKKGNGMVKLIESNASNCVDSSSINVNIQEGKDSSLYTSICYGGSYNFNNTVINTSGIYYDTLLASNGCDSIVELNLSVLAKIDTSINANICTGQTYFFSGQFLNSPGTYYDTLSASNGCDSNIVLNLKVVSTKDSSITASICSGTSYFFDGKAITLSGYYKDTLLSSGGCDSIVSLVLSVLPSASYSMNAQICSNESFLFAGQYLNKQGTYTDTLIAANGCDSVITLKLFILNTKSSSEKVDICFGDSYWFDGQYLNQSGSYYDTLTAVNGCDSLLTLNLNISQKIISNLSASICSGGSYIFNNQNLKTAGNYYDTLLSLNSCDSILILDLEVLAHSSSSISASICSGGKYPFGNKIYIQAGVYKDTLISANACDSIITLNLSVLPNASSSINASICSGGKYLFGNNVYTQTGVYKDTLISTNGCDSIITLNLSVLPTASSSINATICSNDNYFFGGQYLKLSGTYTDTLSAVNSCDSVVSLNLIVLNSSSILQQVTICTGDNYIFNGRTLSVDGIYKDTLINTNGCDSIMTLDLEVIPVDVSVTTYTDSLVAQATSASYQWLECNTSMGTYTLITGATSASYKATVHGSYAVEVTQNNCTDTSVCIPVIVSGVNESTSNFSLNVYPNPTSGMLFVEGDLQSQNEVTIDILNMLGEVILQQNKTVTEGVLRTSFNMENYPKGMYFIQINAGEDKFVKKIVIQ